MAKLGVIRVPFVDHEHCLWRPALVRAQLAVARESGHRIPVSPLEKVKAALAVPSTRSCHGARRSRSTLGHKIVSADMNTANICVDMNTQVQMYPPGRD